MDKLIDSEIVKALEQWIKNYEGTYGNFMTLGNTLDLINRLQAENERLCQINGTLLSSGSKLFQEIEIVKAENERLEKENKHYAELEQGCYVTGVKNIKTEAYKECIEKVKSEIDSQSHSRSLEASGERFRIHKILDNLLKELVGEV